MEKSSKHPEYLERDDSKAFVLQGQYKIIGTLDTLDYSKVYIGHDLEREQDEYAIKQIPLQIKGKYTESPLLKKFTSIAKQYMSIDHISLAKIVDFFYEEGYEYIVMDYIKGRRLQELIDLKRTPFQTKDITDFALMMADALTNLHNGRKNRLFAADICPSKVIITPRGEVVLTDYGLGKFLAQRGDDVPNRGTVGFAPPEQYLPKGTINEQTDIYGFGALLFYMATHVHPSKIEGELPNVSSINTDIGEKLDMAIYKATRLDPKARYTTVKQLVNDIIYYDEEEDISAKSKVKLWLNRLLHRKKEEH